MMPILGERDRTLRRMGTVGLGCREMKDTGLGISTGPCEGRHVQEPWRDS